MTLRLERKYSRHLVGGSSTTESSGMAIGIPSFLLEERKNDHSMRWAAAIAVAVHLVVFLVTFPSLKKSLEIGSPTPQKAYVIHQVRFKPPEPQQAPTRPKTKARKVPIPDPTPDLPEPIITENRLEAPEFEVAEDLGRFVDIPDGPPSPGLPGVLPMSGDIEPPKKIFAPQPGYTEEARQARIQGVVIMQAIIDALGNVTNVRVVKGLPNGLSEKAAQTVQTWRYEPARLNGDPVPVYYNFTVNFTLQ